MTDHLNGFRKRIGRSRRMVSNLILLMPSLWRRSPPRRLAYRPRGRLIVTIADEDPRAYLQTFCERLSTVSKLEILAQSRDRWNRLGLSSLGISCLAMAGQISLANASPRLKGTDRQRLLPKAGAHDTAPA